MNQQRAARRVGAGQAGEHIGPPRRAGLDVLGLVTDLFQLLGHPAGALRLALGGVEFAGVGRVEPDQRADEANHLCFGFGGRRHSHIRTTLGPLGLGAGCPIR